MTAENSNAATGRVVRNALLQYVSLGFNLVLGFVLTPILLDDLGQEGFATYTIVVALVGYVGLGELGIGTATVRRIAAELAVGSRTSLSAVASTTKVIYMGTAALGVVFLSVGFATLTVLVDDDRNLTGAREALLLLGLASSFGFILHVYPALLIGVGRSDLLTTAGLWLGVVGAASQIATVRITHDFVILAGVVAAHGFMGALVIRSVARRLLRDVSVTFRQRDSQVARELLSSSWRNALVAVAAMAAINSDVLIVGAFLSSSAVAAYGVASRAAALLSNVTFRLSEVLVPTYSHHDARGNEDRLFSMFLESSVASTLLALPMAAAVITFGEALLHLWLGQVPENAHLVLAILATALAVAVPGGSAFFLLSGVDRLGFLSKATVCGAVLNVALGLCLTPVIGLTGPAVATLITRTVVDLIVLPSHACRTLSRRRSEFFRPYAKVVVPPAMFLAFSSLIVDAAFRPSSTSKLAIALSAMLVGHAVISSAAAGSERRERVRRIIRRRHA